MHRMQAAQLPDAEVEAELARPCGVQEVLPLVRPPHAPPGDALAPMARQTRQQRRARRAQQAETAPAGRPPAPPPVRPVANGDAPPERRPAAAPRLGFRSPGTGLYP